MAVEGIEKLEKLGKLRRQTAGFVQIEGLLKEALLDLSESKKILDIAPRAAYVSAYTAMLKAGRALLLLKGYIPADGGQHKTVVEACGIFLGKSFSALVGHFENMRRKRNDLTYEAGNLISKSETMSAFEDAVNWLKAIIGMVEAADPQVRFKFDIGK